MPTTPDHPFAPLAGAGLFGSGPCGGVHCAVLAVCALAGLGAASLVRADTPLSLSISQTLTQDSNVLRNNSAKQSDTISSTALKLALDKSYGRQRYQASFTGVGNRYNNLGNYNNNGYDMSLGASTTAASNLLGSITYNEVRQLQRPEDQESARFKETITTKTARLYGQYGLYGRWSANLTGTNNRAFYKRDTAQDKESNGLRLGARYSPTDLLYFDSGYERSKVDTPKLGLSNGLLGDTIDRDTLDVSTRWIVTGLSQLDARLGLTQERSKNDTRRDFNGITGFLNWSYTPAGKITYTVNAQRDTNNAGGQSFGTTTTSTFLTRNLLTSSVGLFASWAVTPKVSASSGFNYQRIEDDTLVSIPGQSFNTATQGTYRTFNLGVNWQYSKALSLGCRAETYRRSRTLRTFEFDGHSMSCTGGFLID